MLFKDGTKNADSLDQNDNGLETRSDANKVGIIAIDPVTTPNTRQHVKDVAVKMSFIRLVFLRHVQPSKTIVHIRLAKRLKGQPPVTTK
jgi:hypothetical protein